MNDKPTQAWPDDIADDDIDDFDGDDQPATATAPAAPYQFLRALNKHKARLDRVRWRERQQRRYRDELDRDENYGHISRHLSKSSVGYKPFQMPLIRFGKFGKSSRIFLDPELRAEMGNPIHEAGVSCFAAMPWKTGFLLHEPMTDRAVYHNNDPFGLIFRTFRKQMTAYLDHHRPMDIFLLHGHLASFGRDNEMLSLGSDGEYLLDTSKPYKSEMIAPERIYMRENLDLVQWFAQRAIR